MRPCASQARACVLCAKLLQCCCPREHDLHTTPAQCNAKQTLSSHFTLHSSHFTLALHTCTSHLHFISTHLIWALLISFHVLHKTRSSTTLYYKACTKYFPILLCTTKLAQTTSQYWCLVQKLAQTTSQYYFVLQSLHTLLPSTTLYYKACAKHFPALLCTTKLAENTSQYYFALQSLQKALPSTTLYYKACTKHFPVLLCTTKLAKHFPVLLCTTKLVPVLLCTSKLAQSTFQYYFVLQILHKARSSITLYFKACTKHVPVLLCTTKLAQSTSQLKICCQITVAALMQPLQYYLQNPAMPLVKKIASAKIAKITDASLSQLGCSHSNTIYDLQLQKKIALRMQPWHRATLTQPRQCDLQRLSCKTQ